MENTDRRKIGILLIIISIIIFTGALIMYLVPGDKEIIEKNAKLNEEQIVYLLKNVQKYLDISSDLKENSFSNESMVKFSLAYMDIDDKYYSHVEYDEENSLAITDVKYISEVVEHIFGITDINFEELGYKIEQGKIHIPVNMQGGDMQIYKYKTTEYIESEDVYIAYIDCLEPLGEVDHELLQSSQIEYDEEDVGFKMQIKYKIENNRKVFLAYNETSKYSMNME